jgi:hypothetical protein
MTKRRPDYHNWSLQIPAVLWEALNRDADAKGVSVTKVLTGILADHYRVKAKDLPKPKRAGRPPKTSP